MASDGAGEPLARVRDRVAGLPYMTHAQALRLRRHLLGHGLRDCLELGFYHGVSSAYTAAILQEAGAGHLTTVDLETARALDPPIGTLLGDLGLADRVTVHFEPRSYTWRLMRLLEQGRHESLDFCYIDGGHFWDPTGFAFLLVERLLRPGGWVLFDDLDWTAERQAERSRAAGRPLPGWLDRLPEEERAVPQVRRVWELLVRPHPGFEAFAEEGAWGFARKRGPPRPGAAPDPPRPGGA